MTNPIPLLVGGFGHTLTSIHRATGYSFKHIDELHNAHNAGAIKEPLKGQLFELSMIEWGQAYARRSHKVQRNYLWKIYFPDTRPHIYHLLHYAHNMDLQEATGYSERVIRRILHQPRLHRRQVDRVRRFAIEYIDAIGSKSRKQGADPAYMGLHYALKDPKRQYMKGEIITD